MALLLLSSCKPRMQDLFDRKYIKIKVHGVLF